MKHACKIVAISSLILAGCASTPEVHRAGESATIGAVVRGKAEAEAPNTVTPAGSEVGPPSRYAILPSDPAARAKIESSRPAETTAAEEKVRTAEDKAATVQWMQRPDVQPYLQWLCVLDRSHPSYDDEFAKARKDYGIVPKQDPETDAESNRQNFATLDCSKFARP